MTRHVGRPIRSEPYRVARKFRVEFTFDAGALTVAWTPRVPALKGAALASYRRARHDFLARVAAETGLRIAVLEV